MSGEDPTDRTELVRDLYEPIQFHRTHDIEVVEVTETHAVTRVPFSEDVLGNPELPAIHGGVISALADLTGAAVVIGRMGTYTPTIDLRVDYVSHAGPTALRGEATLRRAGGSIGVSDVEIYSEETLCAKARGAYKLSRGQS